MADRVHFRGYVHYADLPAFLETADIGVYPLQTGPVNHEISLPNKFFEYSHARLPLVVSNVATMAAEVRRLGNGEVFTSGDAESLAAAIGRCWPTDQYRRAYRDPALLSEYSWERQTRHYSASVRAAPRSRCRARRRRRLRPATNCASAADRRGETSRPDRRDPRRRSSDRLDPDRRARPGLPARPPHRRRLPRPRPARRVRDLDDAVERVAVVPTGPIATFLATAAAVVLAAGRDGACRRTSTSPSTAGVPVIVPARRRPAFGSRERLGAGRAAWSHAGARWPPPSSSSLDAARTRSRTVRARARLGSATPWPNSGPRRDPPAASGRPNSAGQLSELARAVSWNRPDTTVELVAARTAFGPPLPRGRVLREGAAWATASSSEARMRRVLDDYTHLLSTPPGPSSGGGTASISWRTCRRCARPACSTRCCFTAATSATPTRIWPATSTPPYREAPPEVLAGSGTLAPRHRAIAAESGLPLFVTTLDLLDDVPEARWLPLMVDVDRWYCDAPVMERARPVVLHAPSKRWTKGSNAIISVLEGLDAAGMIEFRLAEGLPPARMRDLVRGADLVVDQLAIGCYSTFSVEGWPPGNRRSRICMRSDGRAGGGGAAGGPCDGGHVGGGRGLARGGPRPGPRDRARVPAVRPQDARRPRRRRSAQRVPRKLTRPPRRLGPVRQELLGAREGLRDRAELHQLRAGPDDADDLHADSSLLLDDAGSDSSPSAST